MRSGTEGYDLKVIKSINCISDRKEIVDHVSAIFSVTDRILRDISLYASEMEIVACIEHSAVCISSAILKVSLALFSSCTEHLGAIEMLSEKSLRNLRTEVSKIYTKSFTSGLLDILKSVDHVDLTLNDTDGTLIDVSCIILLGISLYESLAAVNCK